MAASSFAARIHSIACDWPISAAVAATVLVAVAGVGGVAAGQRVRVVVAVGAVGPSKDT